jgi:hypothetical protein
MIRRLGVAALVAALLSTGPAAARPALAADPWTVSTSSGRVAATFVSDTTGSQTTIALENRTSIAEELKLGPDAAFLLKALGLSGTYSQVASWKVTSGPAIACPIDLFGARACMTVASGIGATLIPGSARSALIAKAPKAKGQSKIEVGPNDGSAAYDLALAGIGVVFETLGIDGVALDTVVDLALTIRPEADIVLAALLQGDLRAAGANFLGLVERAWDTIKEKLAGLVAGVVLSLVPGALAIKFGIAVAKVIAPLANLAAVSKGGTTTTVTVAYAPLPRPDASWTWHAVKKPPFAVTTPPVALGDGRMLFAEDLDAYTIGGCINEIFPNHPPTGAAILDPASGTWTEMAPAPIISYRAVPLPHDRVFALGDTGLGANGSPSPAAAIFDPSSNRWTKAAVPKDPDGALGSLSDGRPVSVGTTIQAFDASTGRWSTIGKLRQPRSAESVTLLSSGLLLVNGGASVKGTGPAETDELFDPATGHSIAFPTVSASPYDGGTTIRSRPGGGAWAIVSTSSSPTNSAVAAFDPSRKRWSSPVPTALGDGASVLLRSDGTMLEAGGGTICGVSPVVRVSNRVVVRVLARGTVTKLASLPVAQAYPSLIDLPDGSVLAFGGDLPGPPGRLEYTPVTGWWVLGPRP